MARRAVRRGAMTLFGSVGLLLPSGVSADSGATDASTAIEPSPVEIEESEIGGPSGSDGHDRDDESRTAPTDDPTVAVGRPPVPSGHGHRGDDRAGEHADASDDDRDHDRDDDRDDGRHDSGGRDVAAGEDATAGGDDPVVVAVGLPPVPAAVVDRDDGPIVAVGLPPVPPAAGHERAGRRAVGAPSAARIDVLVAATAVAGDVIDACL